MEETLTVELQRALMEAEKTLQKMQRTRDEELKKTRISYQREITLLEKEIERAKRDAEKTSVQIAKYKKIAAEKTEQSNQRYSEIASLRMTLMREKKRADEAESALTAFKNFATRLTEPNAQNQNKSIQNQLLSELFASSHLAPIAEILGLNGVASSSQSPVQPQPSINASQSPVNPAPTQSQNKSEAHDIISKNDLSDLANTLRAQQESLNAQISALREQKNQQSQAVQLQQYEQELARLRTELKKYESAPISPAPAEISIDELAKSLETAIEEKTGTKSNGSSNNDALPPRQQETHMQKPVSESILPPVPESPNTYKSKSTPPPPAQISADDAIEPAAPVAKTDALDDMIEDLNKELGDLKKQLNEN